MLAGNSIINKGECPPPPSVCEVTYERLHKHNGYSRYRVINESRCFIDRIRVESRSDKLRPFMGWGFFIFRFMKRCKYD